MKPNEFEGLTLTEMKIYNPISKVLTDYEDEDLSLEEVKIKKRLQIAVNAWNKMLAMRTFKNSKFIARKFK